MKRDKRLSVLITGAASGIGKAVADMLVENGHTVYALDICEMQNAEGRYALKGDITSQTDMEKIKEALKKEKVSLDWILNFAGVHTMASFLEEEYDKLKRLLEINLMGAILVNKTFHSLLKKDGKILITSSEVAPLAPLPFNGVYSVSKTALDAYAQALRQEMNLLGQRVVTLRPGAIETPLAQGNIAATERLCEKTELFKAESKHFCALVQKFTGKPMPAEKLAKLVYKILLKKRPKYIYSKHRNLGLTLLGILPLRWQCALVKIFVKN